MTDEQRDPQAPVLHGLSVTLPGPSVLPGWMTDPDEVEWVLRASGVDEELIAEARRRITADASAGWSWLESKLPTDEAPLCDCGLALVERAWRGTATVTCSRCGSVVRLTAHDSGYQQTWVAGPSADWLQEHPDDGYFTVDAVTVLADGLPPIPAEPPVDHYFPVARWLGARKAAVMFLRRIPDELIEVESGRWEERVVFFDRSDNRWIESYDDPGETTFFDPLNPHAGYFERYGVWFVDLHCDSDDDDPDALWVLGGRCGPQVHRIEAMSGIGSQMFEPLPPDRFFLAALTGPGRFRFLDVAGAIVTRSDGRPLDIPTSE